MMQARGSGVLSRMRTVLLATTVLATHMVTATSAQNLPAARSGPQSVSIPAGPLTPALNQLAAQTGMQILFDAPLAQGKTTRGVQGNMAASRALSVLLAGTGLGARATSANSVTIIGPSAAGGALPPGSIPLDTIDVQGAANPNSTMTPMPVYAGGQVATGGQVGMLGNRSVMDTPFNQTSYTAQTIQDQQARTIGAVLENNPAVRAFMPPGSGGESFYMRGFALDGRDIAINGLYGLVPAWTSSSDFAERVEVLNGPSALLNGMQPQGGVGGSVNIVTKKAGDEPLTRFTTTYASKTQLGEHVDIARRFGADNACGVRFNGAITGGNTALENNKNELGLAALGFDCRTDRARFSADLGYQRNNTDGETRYFGFQNTNIAVPAAPPAGKGYTPPWWYLDNETLFGMVKGEFDISPDVTAYAAAGGQSFDLDGLWGVPRFTNSAGDYRSGTFNYRIAYKNDTEQVGFRGTSSTGFVEHQWNVNASTLYSVYDNNYNSGATITSNIYNLGNVPYQYVAAPASRRASETRLSSIGLSDTLSVLNRRVQFTVGVRRQQIDVDSFNATTGALISNYDIGAWSPAFAFVVKPRENVSLYANYIEGLQQGTIVGTSYANAGQVLPPYVSKQIETGIKIDWGSLTSTASVFQITQPNATANTVTNIYSLNGEQRNRGIELNVFGEVTQGLRLLGGVAFMDGRQTKTANGVNDGKKAAAVPSVQLNIGGEWDTRFVDGLTLTGRIIYTGSQYVNTDNQQTIPDWTRVDLGARYKFIGPQNKPITLRFDVLNVSNNSYWASVTPAYVGLGISRTFMLSTSVDF